MRRLSRRKVELPLVFARLGVVCLRRLILVLNVSDVLAMVNVFFSLLLLHSLLLVTNK